MRTRLTVDVNSNFHLPGKHNQKSHGNRAGKKGNTPARTSKHASLPSDATPAQVETRVDEIYEENAAAPPAKPSTPMSPAEFDERAESAATGEDAFQELTFSDWGKLNNHMESIGVTNTGVAYYKEGGYSEINGALRLGTELRDADDPNARMWERTVHGLDSLTAESETKNDILVYRGIDSPEATFGDAWRTFGDNTGLEWTDDGFTSTSANEEVASRFSDDEGGGVRMRILVPGGTPAFTPDRASGQSVNSEEREIIVKRKSTYRVVRDYRDYDEENDVDVRIVDVEVVR